MREFYLDIPTIIIGTIIYIIISKLTISEYLAYKELILIIFLIEIIGLIYDGMIILLGSTMTEWLLMFLNQLRFIFHGLLVPVLILFSGYALDYKSKTYFINLIINIILSIFGFFIGIITELKVEDSGVLKRCTFSDDIPLFINISFILMNIGCVIYMIIAGIILYVKSREYYFLLAGVFMLIFSAIGPAMGNPDITYLLSMYGEVLMIIFLYLYFKKTIRAKYRKSNEVEVNKVN